jgi:hypothetical protein
MRLHGLAVRDGMVLSFSDVGVDAHALADGHLVWRYLHHTRALKGDEPQREHDRLERQEWALRINDGVPGVVYGSSMTAFVALDEHTGVARWSVPLQEGGSYAVVDGTLLVAGDDRLRGFDPSSGAARFDRPAPGVALVTPLGAARALMIGRDGAEMLVPATGATLQRIPLAQRMAPELLAARDGKVVIDVNVDDAHLFWLHGDGLRDADVSDRPWFGAEAKRYREPIEATIDGDRVLIVSLSGALRMFEVK